MVNVKTATSILNNLREYQQKLEILADYYMRHKKFI